MRIGIIGTGRVGSAVRDGWLKAGHEVRAGGRSPDTPLREIADWAEIVVLAVPYAALEAVADAIRPSAAKPVLDCTNPVVAGADGPDLALGHDTSGAERLQALLPEARVVKSLNQVGAEIMADARRFPMPPVQFLAGDDGPAKTMVATLLSDLGFDPLDAGALSRARLLEPLALVWINQALARGKGRNWALAAMEGETKS